MYGVKLQKLPVELLNISINPYLRSITLNNKVTISKPINHPNTPIDPSKWFIARLSAYLTYGGFFTLGGQGHIFPVIAMSRHSRILNDPLAPIDPILGQLTTLPRHVTITQVMRALRKGKLVQKMI